MSYFRILGFLIVIVSFTDCLPPGNITHGSRREFRFPHNVSTAVRHLPHGRLVVLNPVVFPEYLVPRMVVPSIPQVVRLNVPQVVRPNIPQVVRPNILQVLRPNIPQVVGPNILQVVRPNIPQVIMPNLPQVVRPKFPQAVRSIFLQALTSEAPQAMKSEPPQAVKSEVQTKLPQIARDPGRLRLLQPAQPDQLVSASSSSSFRPPSGGWAGGKNTNSRISTGEEQFVFPDNDTPPPKVENRAKFKPVIRNQAPSCADGSTFCEKVDGYPENIENIFDNDLDQFKELQGVDELKTPPITQRIDINATNEQPLCPSVEEVAFPRIAKNKDDKWLFVVNTGSFVQGVRVEKCLKTSNDPEQKCNFNDSFPNGYTTVCKQKYIYRRMVALDEDGKRIKDEFVLPSCCSCAVISVGDVSFRQGAQRKALRTTTTPAPKS